MMINLNPLKILKIFFLSFFILLILNLLVIFTCDNRFLIYKIFHFNIEKNLPTLYSALNLFLSSLLLIIISRSKKQNKKTYISWLILSFIFFFLALDEGIGIHERLNQVVRYYFEGIGTLFSLWMIPYSVLLVLFIATYLRFWLSLPDKYRKLFLISGVLYVGGALGINMVAGAYGVINGSDTIIYNLLTTLEESLEMIGIIIFNFSLLSYLTDYLNEEITIKIAKSKQ